MQLFHDRKANRIVIVQEAHPIVAWACIIPFGLAMAVAAPYAWFEPQPLAGLLAAFFAATAVLTLWFARWILTEIAATFDANAQVLTLRRTRPWGEASKTIAFADIFDVVTADFRVIDYVEYRVDILLAGERKVRLRSGGEKDIEATLAEVRRLIRR